MPPDSYGLGVGFDRPRYHEGAFEFLKSYKVGDRVCVLAILYNKSNFFYQTILYADDGPIYCTVTIETDEGKEEHKLKLLSINEYLERENPSRYIETIPYTTIKIERMGDDGAYPCLTIKQVDYVFTKPGTYTFSFYAAFQQLGRNYYVEQDNPADQIIVTVTEN